MKTNFTIAFLLMVSLVKAQTTIDINCSADANFGYNGTNSMNSNGGSALFNQSFIQPGTAPSTFNGGRSVLLFDLSSIPQNVIIQSATLDLYGYGPCGAGQVTSVGNYGTNPCSVSRVTSTWTEMGVTWNTQPTFDTTDQAILPVSTNAYENYLGTDVTQMVQAMYANQSANFGFMLHQVNESLPANGMIFCSREFGNVANHPVLHVQYKFHDGVGFIPASTGLFQVNPTVGNGSFELLLNKNVVLQNASVIISNISGSVVKQIALEDYQLNIDLASIEKGTYIISLMLNGKAVETKKLVVN